MNYLRNDATDPSQTFVKWWTIYRLPIIAAIALNLLAFGYLFFTYIYTNHVFPNIFDMGYPTFRTILEGRWGADFIYQLQGARAIPLLNLMLAVPMQIANGVIFARLLNLQDKWSIFFAATLISIHPFVTDYYAFAGDHLPLVLGDTFILLGFYFVCCCRQSFWAIVPAAVFFQAGLSCYQPKIGIVVTLWTLLLLGRLAVWDGTTQMLREHAREMFSHAVGIIAGIGLYMALLSLSQWWMGNPAEESAHSEKRLAIIDPALVIHQTHKVLKMAHYSFFASDFFGNIFQSVLGLLILIVVGVIALNILQGKAPIRIRLLAFISLVLGIILLPFAVYAPFMISESASQSGRILLPVAYLSAFAPLILLTKFRSGALWGFVVFISLYICYRFVIINAEAGHLSHLRSSYEFQFVNRVVSRIEQEIDPVTDQPYALVVIGELPLPHVLAPSTETRSNLNERGFINYRQVEMLNFFMAREILEVPNSGHRQLALDYAIESSVWPGQGSVTVLDDRIVVVVFETPHSNVITTMTVP